MLAAPRSGTRAGDTESGPLLQLQGQLQANQAEISNRERAMSGLEARINEYQARLNSQPAIEQQLADLNRGYEQSKANYDDLLKKKNQSAMATSMERMQQGERFTMLDPPTVPTRPDFPNRLKFCGLGVLFGAVVGALVVFLFEFFDDRLHGEKEIKALLSMPVLSEIPEVQSPADLQRASSQRVWGWTVAAVVGLVIAVGSAYSYLRG